jgi:hypothetical protein
MAHRHASTIFMGLVVVLAEQMPPVLCHRQADLVAAPVGAAVALLPTAQQEPRDKVARVVMAQGE